MLSILELRARMRKAHKTARILTEALDDDMMELTWIYSLTESYVIKISIYHVTVTNADFQREMFAAEKYFEGLKV